MLFQTREDLFLNSFWTKFCMILRKHDVKIPAWNVTFTRTIVENFFLLLNFARTSKISLISWAFGSKQETRKWIEWMAVQRISFCMSYFIHSCQFNHLVLGMLTYSFNFSHEPINNIWRGCPNAKNNRSFIQFLINTF